jgi:uncharacterized protein YhfF
VSSKLRIGIFDDVEWDWIVYAGEGDQSVEEWREGYLDYDERTTASART